MKKILTICLFLSQIITYAQDNNNLKTCGSDVVLQTSAKDNSEMAAKMAAFELAYKNHTLTSKAAPDIHKVPVVVHVMHKGEAIGVGTNITDDVVKAKIKFVNEQFRKIPGSAGDGEGVDMQIEFVLAVVDPDGNQTNGIVRYDMSAKTAYMNYGVNSTGNKTPKGISQTEMKALSVWDSNLYYNIWTVSEIDDNGAGSGIQGETVPPQAYDANNNLVILHGTAEDGLYLLSKNVQDPLDRTLTHELGHAFFLYHTFQGDVDTSGNIICPPNTTPSSQGDLCADTPAHKRTTSGDCSDTSNTCYPDNLDLSYLNNYMNYTLEGCRNMFTADQRTRALYTITEIRQSLLLSDVLSPVDVPVAGFLPSQPVVVIKGSSLQLSDASVGVPNNYLNDYTAPGTTFGWNVTDGNTTLTATNQNPVFNFTSEGIYNVSHNVDNGFGTSSKTTNQVIYVTAPTAGLPTTPTSTSNGNYSINYVNLNTIQKTIIPLANTPYADYVNTDNTLLISGNSYQLNFNTRSGSPYTGYFAGYVDWDGNGIFSEVEKLGAGSISANQSVPRGVALAVPTNCAKNKLLRLRLSINANAAITNAMINGTTPFFIGDTKDFGLYIIDPQALGTEQFALNNLSYYPNPVKDELNITNTVNIEKVEVYNITGQLLLSENFQGTNIKVNLSQLVRGAYIATVYANGAKSSIKILKN